MRDAPAHEPLTDIRRLYDAWNAGDVARAAALLSPTVTNGAPRVDEFFNAHTEPPARLAGR